MAANRDLHDIVRSVRDLHRRMVDRLRASMAHAPFEEMSRPAGESEGDVLYALDRDVDGLVEAWRREEAPGLGVGAVVGEGLGGEGRDEAAPWVAIIDPVDGTRGLMYGKRSAWILTGIAPGPLASARLAGVRAAVQTEIPTPRSPLSDQLWAVRGEGTSAVTRDLVTGAETPLPLTPSRATSVAGGFAGVARFFPPGRDRLARLDDELMRRVLGGTFRRAPVFEDQYLSTGGQLHQLVTGRDRFIAELRAPLYDLLEREGLERGHDCHPYDLATAQIAREAGVVVTAPGGGDLDFPLDATTPVAWVGYANESIRAEIEPHLDALLAEILGL